MSTETPTPILPGAPVSVAQLCAAPPLALTWLGGQAGEARTIAAPRIQKPGLALSGWPEQLHSGRVLILGGTEIDYLAQVDDLRRGIGIATLLAAQPACVVVTRGLAAPPELQAACEGAAVPLLSSGLVTAEFIAEVTEWLGRLLAPRTRRHGVLVDILGVGVLLTGKSGIGKSETALDLVVRGHRLVADDVVELWSQHQALLGAGVESIRHHMEIRGLGIINIKDLFGIAAVRSAKRVDLLIELVDWSDLAEYDRLGVDEPVVEIIGVRVPRLTLPVRPGRNLSTLVEVAARNQLLKAEGHHSARRFVEGLRVRMHEVGGSDAADALE